MTTGSTRSIAVATSGQTTCWAVLHVKERFLGVLLDEVPAGLDVLAHEDGEHAVGLDGILQLDSLEDPALRVHGRLPQLLGFHLRKSLEPLDVHLLLAVVLSKLVQRLVVVYVEV